MLEDRSTARTNIENIVKDAVRPAIFPARTPLTAEAHAVHGEPISVTDAIAAAFEPFAIGGRWGAPWDTTWFRFRGTVPETWAGAEVVARLRLGEGAGPGFTVEGLIWRDGAPVHGLHPFHQETRITDRARGGEAVELLVEAAANQTPPFNTKEWPLLRADFGGAPLYTLSMAELAVVDREVEALWFDLRALTQLLDIEPQEPRASRIFRALVEATNTIDRRDVAGTAKAARAVLAPVLAEGAHRGHRITAVGHAHIDSAWLWPVRETKRKCARTFANQIALMDEYPEHRFACSQAQQYEWIRDGYPELWARIKEKVAEGRWEPVGGMWVEPDTNVPSGESLVRQLVYGARFFEEELGVTSDELWIPDVFGYSAALPQIAVQGGMRALITQKLSWNSINRFPHSTFVWEGNDGSRLLTHFPPADTYNGVWSAEELAKSITRFNDHGRSDASLYLYGFGDGGGGPNRHMLEMSRRLADLAGLPRAEIGTVDGFLDSIAADVDALDTWVGELYFELHRGTYTTQAAIKRGNRRCEEALREAELWWTAVGDASAYPQAELERLWKTVLLDQFHDIIPGSSINWVNEDARRDHEAVLASASALIAQAQERLGGGVFNPARVARREVVDVPGRGLAVVDAPACGFGPVSVVEGVAPVTVSGSSMENEHLRVTWDADGLLTSVWDKAAQREVLAGRGNVFQVHEDHPIDYDAWDVDLTYLDRVVDVIDAESVTVDADGPLRAEVRVVRRFGASSISQVIRLDAGARQVVFDTEVDWHEHHRFLKVAFPVDVRSSRATYEIQHGWLERPTVWNTSWDLARFEVCAHRWADLSETGYGVALLNDCKYGYDIKGNVMRLSLLRAPGWPDPEADRGLHRFAYALLPHAGDPHTAGVAEAAEVFNLPLDIVGDGSSSSPTSRSIVSVDRAGVSVEAVKRADRADGVVVRLCEVTGRRGTARVHVDVPFRTAVRTDLLERGDEPVTVEDGAIVLALRPFELVTLLLR